ncbi:hypothetical protein P9139_16135 [Curtobacterium flaccumfaciens]|nr:hypothetical protein P9139_16135 [Curtobacterium flaccumfaciens]
MQAQLGREGRGDRSGGVGQRQRVTAVGDRVEELLGGEVEPGEFVGGEHPHGELRRLYVALHEDAVEFALHELPEPVHDEDGDGRRHRDQGERRDDPGSVSLVIGVDAAAMHANVSPSTAMAAATSRAGRRVAMGSRANPAATEADAVWTMSCSGQMPTKSSVTTHASTTQMRANARPVNRSP